MDILGAQTCKLLAGQSVGLNVFDPGFDLTHQIGTDVRRLGEDAPTDTHEQGRQRPAEPETDQDTHRLLAEN